LRATLSLEQSAGEELRGSIVLQAHDGRVLAVARGVEGEFRHRDPRFLRARGPGTKPAYAVATPPPATPPQGTARIANGNGSNGEKPLDRELEPDLARFLGCEDAVVTVSGHGVFVTVIGHLMGPQDLILHDSLAHDCIMGGSKLSGAKRRPFPHNDPEALEKQ